MHGLAIGIGGVLIDQGAQTRNSTGFRPKTGLGLPDSVYHARGANCRSDARGVLSLWNRFIHDALQYGALLNFENLHHLVAQVVDHFDRDAAGFGLFEGAGGVAVQGGPGFGVDFGFEPGFQGVVGSLAPRK